MNTELHFLIVNDEANMRLILLALLKEIGYVKVSEAENGEMALRALKAAKLVGTPIEFIITDYAMPLMDGLNLIRSVREDPETADMPILMFTARAHKANILAAAEAGADDYIVGPFKASSLRKKLERMLAKRNLTTVDLPGGEIAGHSRNR